MTKPISSEKYLRGAGLALKAGEKGEAAEFFLKGGEFETAALLFEKLEQHGRAAVAYAKAGQPLDAASAWERAGEYSRAAEIYAEAGNIPEAARAFACAGESIRAAELFAQTGRFLDAAKAASEANSEKTMITYLQKVTPNDPDYREAALVLARALTRRGWSALAIETIERVLGKEPVREEALELWYELARAHEEHGELVEGESYARMLQRKGRLDLAEVMHFLVSVCQGLDHAHRRGVIHRDIKPSNILLTVEDRVKIVDFGLAQSARASQARAFILGRDFVIPEDVKAIAVPVLAHRLALDTKAKYSGTQKEDVVREILDATPVGV